MENKLTQLEKLSNEEWESICERCARCCYEKIDFNGRIFYTKKPCDQLDLKTGLCRVYAERDRVRPDCQRLSPDIVSAGILPPDCPYVQLHNSCQGPIPGEEV